MNIPTLEFALENFPQSSWTGEEEERWFVVVTFGGHDVTQIKCPPYTNSYRIQERGEGDEVIAETLSRWFSDVRDKLEEEPHQCPD